MAALHTRALRPTQPPTASKAPSPSSRQKLAALSVLPHATTTFLHPRRMVSCAADSNSEGGSAKEDGKQSKGQAEAKKEINWQEVKLPKTGYFTIADPNAEVYSKAGEKFDPRVRGGRYKSDFIWNTNWQEAMKREEQLTKQYEDAQKNRSKDAAAAADVAASIAGALTSSESSAGGTVSFSRMSQLNSMDSDLSEVFAALKKKDEEKAAAKKKAEEEAARRPKEKSNPAVAGAPMRGTFEARQLMRRSRSSRNTVGITVASSKAEDTEAKLKQQQEDRIKYDAMKLDFQIWTLVLAAVGGVTTYSIYSTDVAASYMFGALGGFVYLRLLSKSVDGIGGGGDGSAAQPRLLIPVILALGFNRWNFLAADKYGITLELLPILVGFFTYKFAVLARETKSLVEDMKA